MYIKKLDLSNYRNYEKVCIEFDKGYNIIYGDNAQGKTNIIESIYLCATGRSHRTPRDEELVMHGANGYRVGVQIEKRDRLDSIEILYEKGQRKKVKINEIPVGKLGDLMGNLNAVIFSPEDLFIIKEGPSERRRFLDITISQLRPSDFYDLQQYLKVLYQRNMLLKEILMKRELLGTIDIWNSQLVKAGARIMKSRKEFIEKLNIKANEKHEKLTDYKEEMEISYSPSFKIDNLYNLEDIQKEFDNVVASAADKEFKKCTTLFGPHRDDYDIMINGMNTKLFGSQGQQRTSVISIKLSEIDIIKEETGDFPVLLLDDVLSELDRKRQEYLFESIGNIQTFITCTDKAFYSNNNINANYMKVTNGYVT